MIRIFKTIDGKMHQMEEACEGCWVALTNPTATEIFEICNRFQIEVDDLRAPLDEEERSRIEVEENYTLILVDTPIIEERGDKDWFGTIPLSIIITNEMIFTVCLEDTSVLGKFMDGRVRNFYTYMKTRFILQILYNNASMFLHYLRIIDKKSEEVEEKLHASTRNQELIELLELEKSLVYFITSLRSNEVVLEKLLKVDRIKKYPDDTDLLEDVIVENKQAIEMANIYSGILSGMTDAFASVISNNLNIFGNSYDCNVHSDDDFQCLWNECKIIRDAICRQSVWICHCNCAVFDTKSDCGNYFFKERPVLGFIPLI